jgi:D-arabinose 1-dehydrogenase-like Zn-dependent alcohol dehydrogenase
MKAWQKHFGPTEPQLVDIPVPTCSDDGLLIKVHAAGVCHSDFALIVSDYCLLIVEVAWDQRRIYVVVIWPWHNAD